MTFQQFVVPRTVRSEKYVSPTVVCGGCSTSNLVRHVPVNEAYRIRVPDPEQK